METQETHHVFLIPGFFGFANLGDLAYFGHVLPTLGRALQTAGATARIHVVKTRPTGAFRARAARLRDAIMRETAASEGPIHLIGHSSGGIDARVLLAPDTVLPGDPAPDELLARVRSVVCVSTPHRGTPMASMFDSILGGKLLALLSLATMNMIRFGHVPLAALSRFVGLLARLDDIGPANSTLLDQLFGQLLEDFSAERAAEIRELLGEVVRDQSLISALKPDDMAALDRTTPDRPGVRYGAVVTRSRAPGLTSTLAAGLDPSAHATHALYTALYRINATMPKERLAAIDGESARAFLDAYGALPFSEDNDGIVPTLSQLHGRVLAAVRADHLDVIGHFNDPSHVPPHWDWLATGTGFTREGFDAVWRRVAAYLLGAE